MSTKSKWNALKRLHGEKSRKIHIDLGVDETAVNKWRRKSHKNPGRFFSQSPLPVAPCQSVLARPNSLPHVTISEWLHVGVAVGLNRGVKEKVAPRWGGQRVRCSDGLINVRWPPVRKEEKTLI